MQIQWNLDFFEAAKTAGGSSVDLSRLPYPFKLEDRHMEYLDALFDREVYEAIDMDGFAAYLNHGLCGFEIGIMAGDKFIAYDSDEYNMWVR